MNPEIAIEKDLTAISFSRDNIEKGIEDLKRMHKDLKPLTDALSAYRQSILATREPGEKVAEELCKFGEKYQNHNKFAQEFLHVGKLQSTLEQLRYDWQCKLWDNLILPVMNLNENVKRDIDQAEKLVKPKAQKIEAQAKKLKQDNDKQKKKSKAETTSLDTSLLESLNSLRAEMDMLRLYLNNYTEQICATCFKPFGIGMSDQLIYHETSLKHLSQSTWYRILNSEPSALPDIGQLTTSPKKAENKPPNSSNLRNSGTEEEATSNNSPPVPLVPKTLSDSPSPLITSSISSNPPSNMATPSDSARTTSPRRLTTTSRRLSMKSFRRKSSTDSEDPSNSSTSYYQRMKADIVKSCQCSLREGTGKFSKRFACLTGDYLSFFNEDPEKGNEKLKVNLNIKDLTYEVTTTIKKVPYCILLTALGKTYYMQLNSEDEVKEWIQTLKFITKIDSQRASNEQTIPSPTPSPTTEHQVTKPLPEVPIKEIKLQESTQQESSKQQAQNSEAKAENSEAKAENSEAKAENSKEKLDTSTSEKKLPKEEEQTSPKSESTNDSASKREWVQYETDDGEIAYMNTVTGETSWEKPT